MKVDKGVCTTDPDTAAVEDMNKAQRYGAVFTTLLENKILAIKRESEESELRQKNHKKKRKSQGGLVLGKGIFCIKGNSETENDLALHGNAKECLQSSIKDTSLQIKIPTSCHTTNEVCTAENSSIHPCREYVSADETNDGLVDNSSGAVVGGGDGGDGTSTKINIKSHFTSDGKSNIKENFNAKASNTQKITATVNDDKHHLRNIECGVVQKCETDSISSNERNKKISFKGDVTNDTLDKYSRKQFDELSYNPHSSFFEINVSDDSLKKTRKSSTETTISFPSSEHHRLRVLEAKSVSAQCSPIFPRALHTNIADPEVNDHQSRTGIPLKMLSRQYTSEDSANITFSSIVDGGGGGGGYVDRKRTTTRQSTSSLVISSYNYNNKMNEKLVSQAYTHDDSHGFISNFNQLTSNNIKSSINIKLPVITTTKKLRTSKCDKKNTSSVHTKYKNGPERDDAHQLKYKPSNDTTSIISTEENKRHRKHFRRGHRSSDPVLVYPASNSLQQCILSMPPNQSIQLQYDDDMLYDMSVQMESNSNGDLEVIVPGHRKQKRRHHHCHHHGRRHDRSNKTHKKKILVHDLDTQSVKVIDSDDLPQRARWTIIATACLLLIMCLLLVGVTLRMAPLIDDMVRQENERLMQESFNRAKFARNLTDPVPLAAGEEIP